MSAGNRMLFRAPAFVFGENIDTDIIIPARHLTTVDPAELASHCMEPVRPAFAAQVAGEGILVAGQNFGCGSSREHAPVALIGAGIRCVLAESLARIFYRNAVNTGLPAIICPGITSMAGEGDLLEVDVAAGEVRNVTTGQGGRFEPLPPFMTDILVSGGLLPYLEARKWRF
jgi:3-isopropylmalate/(R)-2-methylmalate dehydratase small subunit